MIATRGNFLFCLGSGEDVKVGLTPGPILLIFVLESINRINSAHIIDYGLMFYVAILGLAVARSAYE